LVVDPNTVLALPISFELLKPVSGWDSKVLNSIGGINEKELDKSQSVELSGKPLGPLTVEYRPGDRTLEAADHNTIITSRVNNVKR